MTTALILDDNDLNLETLRLLLRKEGIAAVTLSSPLKLEAQLADIGQIDIVFLDLEFPNHNGLALIGELRQIPQLAGVPIIAYSVHISELNETRAAGFDGFIGKPLNPHKFPDQLRRVLAGKAVWEVGQ